MVIDYVLYAALFKDFLNSSLAFAIVLHVFECFIFIYVEHLVLQVFTTAEW